MRCASETLRRCRSAGAASTTALPMPRRCSSCSSARCGGGAWLASSWTNSSRTRPGPSSGSSTSATPTATGTSSTGGPPTGVWPTRAGRTAGTESATATAGWRRPPSPSPRCRPIPTALTSPAPTSPSKQGMPRHTIASVPRQPSSKPISTGTSGSRRRAGSPSASMPTKSPSTRSPPIWATACGLESWTRTRRCRWPRPWCRPPCSPDGGCAPFRATTAGTTRSATTAGRCGRTTRRSPPQVSLATASTAPPNSSSPACSMRPRPRAVGCRSSSAGSTGVSSTCRSATPRRALHKHGQRPRRSCACARCSGSTRGSPTARYGCRPTCPRGSAT